MMVELIAGLAATVAGGLVVNWISESARNRVSVHRVTKIEDPAVSRLIELYAQLFPDGSSNYNSDDILEMLRQQQSHHVRNHVKAEDVILVAKFNRDVVGFIFCHYYRDRHKAIVSYYGIDKDVREARQSAADVLLKSMRHTLNTGGRKCDYLFFDVDRPGVVRRKEENATRKARITRFKRDAIAFGLHAYCLKFDYSSPRITLSQGTKETPLILMVVPLDGTALTTIPRSQAIDFIKFVYLDCYGDIYETTDPRHADYHKHLFAKIARYEKSLPDSIEVE